MNIRDIADALAPADNGCNHFARGVVVAVDSTGKRVTIQKSGSTTNIPNVRYLRSYTPAVNDVVQLVVNGPSIWILGALA